MADYISREAAIERFCNVYCGCSPEECGFKIQQDGAEECAAVRALKETPAADVRPVVHGEWRNAHPSSPMLDGGGPPYCSVCGKEAPLRSVEVNQWKLERGSLSGPEVVYKTKCFLSNFCPNCGAEMKPNLDTTKGDNHD